MKIMEEKQVHQPLALEITFNQKEDILELSKDINYRKFIIEETYKNIKENISSKQNTIQLFEIINMGIIVSLNYNNLNKCLENILKYYESVEDYTTCLEIKDILKKL